MKKLAHSIERDSFDWEVEVTITEHPEFPHEWQVSVMTPDGQVNFDRMTKHQFGLVMSALRRAVVVASVKVNPLDNACDDDL